jgi:hypothetical protein
MLNKLITCAALIGLLAVSGCCSIKGERVLDDGSVLKISNTRFFWSSEGIDFSVTDLQGFTTSLKVSKSSVDSTALQIAIDGALKAAAQGAMFAVQNTNAPKTK